MYTAIYMIPFANRFLERNARLGGYKSREKAEQEVMRRGMGYVREYESGKIVSAVMNGRIFKP